MPETRDARLLCTCEGTMTVEADRLGGTGRLASQLCRAQLDNFRAALGEFAAITVACTQEAPLFSEVAQDQGYTGDLRFANLRETAGWATEGAQATPKMAALLAMAETETTTFDTLSLESRGVALLLGRDDTVIEAARALAGQLDLTVLLLPGSQVAPPRETTWPVMQGRVSRGTGHLGAFELTVDAFAAAAPSSRARLDFGAGRDGAVSRCDLILDLTGAPALFHHTRPGYLRADPRDPAAVARAVAEAGQMVGIFDKPKYIDFTPDLCAHSRNTKTGCTRCLSLCPTGAITSAGDTVMIDPAICAGCGQCAAACPSGAAAYALPVVEALAQRLRRGLAAWYEAGASSAPTILFHDESHGAALIDASARFGRGLPAHVIPVAINEPSQVGPEIVAAALAWGAGAVRVLAPSRPAHPLDGLAATGALIDAICAEKGLRADSMALIQTDDPDALDAALAGRPTPARARRSSFMPPEDKRGLLTLAIEELIRTAPTPAPRITLPEGAPLGTVHLDLDACTLCLACVGACPSGALGDNPDAPMLRFTESACLQCGLCAATCPETAITLEPRVDIEAWSQPKRLLKEEAPLCCSDCGKPFGTQSSLRRVLERLDGHWMFTGDEGAARRKLLGMCDDCRTRAVVIAGFDPHDKPA